MDGEQAPPPQASGSSWTAFVKSITSFSGDLSSLTAPPFILSGTSLTEFSSYWCEHPAIFAAPAAEPDPRRRALLVLKWFLTTLKQQYASRSEQYGNEKKPLNPFLGELFLGRWEDGAVGTTELVSEQVSHHPPATAYCIFNPKTGVKLQGYNAQKATFSRSLSIKQLGHAVLTVPNPAGTKAQPDTYIITLPSLHIEGLFVGSPFIELDGASYIVASTGFTSRVDYSGKGWLSGKSNSFTAVTYPTGAASPDKEALFSVVGRWTKSFDIRAGAGGKRAELIETVDLVGLSSTPLAVRPVDDQHPLESRRAWLRVAAAIKRGDMDAVGAEKSRIEKAQRALRKRERDESRDWDRRFFAAFAASPEEDPFLRDLARHAGLPDSADADKTGGLWRFVDADAAVAARRALDGASPAEMRALAAETLGETSG